MNIITLTPKALQRVSNLKKNNDKLSLRVSLSSKGCSGQSYELDLVEEAHKNDMIVNQDNLNIFIDNKSSLLLWGTVVDNQGFIFKNPNETSRCGCGESFTCSTR
jgi:iron-sulfur cluster assembly protein